MLFFAEDDGRGITSHISSITKRYQFIKNNTIYDNFRSGLEDINRQTKEEKHFLQRADKKRRKIGSQSAPLVVVQ